jgi:hypothetical protein
MQMNSLEPDLRLGGFSLWVSGRQFPDVNDFWDGNWLHVEAHMQASGALVEARGPILHASEIAKFVQELEPLHTNLTGEAALRCIEPNLEIVIRCDALGHVTVRVVITPDHMTQSHVFTFDLDQTYLGPLLDGCRSVLSNWPIRGGTLRKVEEYLARFRAGGITPETELYGDLGIYGDDIFELVLWTHREFGVEPNLRIAEYAPGEWPFVRLCRALAKLIGRKERKYKSLKVRDVVTAIETKRWPE